MLNNFRIEITMPRNRSRSAFYLENLPELRLKGFEPQKYSFKTLPYLRRQQYGSSQCRPNHLQLKTELASSHSLSDLILEKKSEV